MLDAEYSIASRIASGALREYAELTEQERRVFAMMSGKDWVVALRGRRLILTPDGETALLEHESSLEQLRQQQAKQDEERRANDAKAIQDKNEDRAHDFKVAAFTVVLTLFTERAMEIVEFPEISIDVVLAAGAALALVLFFSHV